MRRPVTLRFSSLLAPDPLRDPAICRNGNTACRNGTKTSYRTRKVAHNGPNRAGMEDA